VVGTGNRRRTARNVTDKRKKEEKSQRMKIAVLIPNDIFRSRLPDPK
jgi:hypothetical protein